MSQSTKATKVISAPTLYMLIANISNHEVGIVEYIQELCGVYKNEKCIWGQFIREENLSALINAKARFDFSLPTQGIFDHNCIDYDREQVREDKIIKYYVNKEKSKPYYAPHPYSLALYGLYSDCLSCPAYPKSYFNGKEITGYINTYIVEIVKSPYFEHHNILQNKELLCNIVYHTENCYEVIYKTGEKTTRSYFIINMN